MNKEEFDKWFDNATDIGNNSGASDYGQCNIGWNAARDKIIEILKQNTNNIKFSPARDYYLNPEVIETIEKL